MDEQTHRSKESPDLEHGIVLDNPVVSISKKNPSSLEENPNGETIRDLMDEGTSGNSSNSDIAGEITSFGEENKDLGIQIDEPRLKKINSEENQCKVMVDDKSMKNVSEGKKKSCVIDVRCGNGGFKDSDGERVCRICHLSSEGLAETKATGFSAELMQLGCGCKDELGIAHGYCAEAWFKLKGNRICEICGEMARNITGVGDNRFMEEWNQRRYVGTSITIPSDGSNGCWRGQPFCNFLMACLVVAFVLPWFFRVNMF